ncbi:putative voltage-gated K channel beta subunit [Xylariomycetidae sp. FL0641]|nr:putative voltage-gated K channel beta subunit [Xylariomycetidae sp. FL0641]
MSKLPKMKYRFLGKSGLQVSVIGLGGWINYGGYVNKEKTIACMKAAYDCGINFFDCSDHFAGGMTESIMGEVIRRLGWQRNDIVLSVKIDRGTAESKSSINNRALSRKHVIDATNTSLRRLGVQYIDIVWASQPEHPHLMEETVRAFNFLIDQGKIMYWGTSDWSVQEIMSARSHASRLGLVAPVAEQPLYNVMDRDTVESKYRRLYADGLGIAASAPLRMGILTGKYEKCIPKGSRFARAKESEFLRSYIDATPKEKFDALVWHASRLDPLAKSLKLKMGQLALAWVLGNRNVSVAIVGATTPEQVYENVMSLHALEMMSKGIMDFIDTIMGNKPKKSWLE